jgi:hypothetical protein
MELKQLKKMAAELGIPVEQLIEIRSRHRALDLQAHRGVRATDLVVPEQ